MDELWASAGERSFQLLAYFSYFQRDPASGKGKGFGFVTYNSHDSATLAIAHVHGYAWEKNEYRSLQVSFKTSK